MSLESCQGRCEEMSGDGLTAAQACPPWLGRDELDAHDLTHYHSELNCNAPKLFVAGEESCKIEVREHVNHVVQRDGSHEDSQLGPRATWIPRSVNTAEALQAVLNESLPPGSTSVITIYRANSWSRMKITAVMFITLCRKFRVTPRFLDLVRGMGYKSRSDDEYFMSCYCSLSSDAKSGVNAVKREGLTSSICYNLRHFEKHGRDIRDPWSRRQSIFYHSYDLDSGKSSWIVIHPPGRWNTGLDDVNPDKHTHPLSLHFRSLSSVISNTWEYLEYMSSEILSLDQRVSFPKPVKEYDFDFTLNQDVHALRKKLHRAKGIIEGMLRIVAALSSHAREIHDLRDSPDSIHDRFTREMANVLRDIQSHQSTTNVLLNHLADIKSTINSILELRNQEMLTNNGEQLRRIAEANSRETLAMTDLAKWTNRDSRTMRIATTIGLMYLPLNLVLSFFSTVFVEFSTQTSALGDSNSSGLIVHEQVWTAVVSMAILILLTGCWYWLMDQRQGGNW